MLLLLPVLSLLLLLVLLPEDVPLEVPVPRLSRMVPLPSIPVFDVVLLFVVELSCDVVLSVEALSDNVSELLSDSVGSITIVASDEFT